jgi:hypothetical protein
LPNRRSYSFEHNGFLGQLSKIELPTGAVVSYSYKLDNRRPESGTITQTNLKSQLNWYEILENAPTLKTVEYKEKDSDAAAVRLTWTYAFTNTGSTVTRPDGGQTVTEAYRTDYKRGAGDVRAGLVYRTTRPDGTRDSRMGPSVPRRCRPAGRVPTGRAPCYVLNDLFARP